MIHSIVSLEFCWSKPKNLIQFLSSFNSVRLFLPRFFHTKILFDHNRNKGTKMSTRHFFTLPSFPHVTSPKKQLLLSSPSKNTSLRQNKLLIVKKCHFAKKKHFALKDSCFLDNGPYLRSTNQNVWN